MEATAQHNVPGSPANPQLPNPQESRSRSISDAIWGFSRVLLPPWPGKWQRAFWLQFNAFEGKIKHVLLHYWWFSFSFLWTKTSVSLFPLSLVTALIGRGILDARCSSQHQPWEAIPGLVKSRSSTAQIPGPRLRRCGGSWLIESQNHIHCTCLPTACYVLPPKTITWSRDCRISCLLGALMALESLRTRRWIHIVPPTPGQAATVCAHPGDRFLSSEGFQEEEKARTQSLCDLWRIGLTISPHTKACAYLSPFVKWHRIYSDPME